MKTPEIEFLLELAEEAGKMTRAAYHPTGVSFDTKEDLSPVTETDIAINQMVIDKTKDKYPEWGILGEELQHNTDANRLIVVDPIDGTRPFSFGVPVFGFMAAIVDDGEVIASVVSNPIVYRTLYAHKGKGSYHLEGGDVQIKVSDTKTLERKVVNLSSSGLMSTYMRRYFRGDHKASTFSLGSLCEAGSHVALGNIVLQAMFHTSTHDAAALKVLVEEAGGKVTDVDGNEQKYNGPINGAIMTNGHVHAEVLSIYKKALEDYNNDKFNEE